MHIEYLSEFIVLAKELNYSVAAERLYITQPVLSRHIIALEKHLGVSLLERSTQMVRLTREGKVFYERIQGILAQYHTLRDEISHRDMYGKMSVCVGVSYYAISDYLGVVPDTFEKKNPDIRLSYVTGDPNDVVQALLAERADVILIPNIPFSGSERLVFRDLFPERLGILCSRKGAFAQKKEITLAELAQTNFLSVDNDFFRAMREETRALFLKEGIEPQGLGLLNQMEAVLIEIARGDSVTVVGEHMRSVPLEGLCFIPFAGERYTRRISLCVKKGKEHPAVPLLYEAFRTRGGNGG